MPYLNFLNFLFYYYYLNATEGQNPKIIKRKKRIMINIFWLDVKFSIIFLGKIGKLMRIISQYQSYIIMDLKSFQIPPLLHSHHSITRTQLKLQSQNYFQFLSLFLTSCFTSPILHQYTNGVNINESCHVVICSIPKQSAKSKHSLFC